MEWLPLVGLGWSVVVAVPGFIALYWGWRDRQRRNRERRPFAVLKPAYDQGHKSHEGWIPLLLWVRNELPIPLKVTALEVKGPRGVLLALNDHATPPRPDASRRGSGLIVDWEIRPKSSGQWSTRTLLFAGSTARSISVAQVSIRLRYFEMDASRTKRTATAISDRIEMPKVTS